MLDVLIGDDTNFLIGIYNYSIELQQAYSLTKDISKAIDEANANSSNYNLVKRMEEIEKILDDQEAMEEYIVECPNEYLKLIAINFNLINENGDKKDVDGKSVFQENLFYTNALIEAEVFKRRRLQFWLRGLSTITIVPLLAFSPFEMWVGKILPITDIFYKTQIGFLFKLGITLIAIAIFYIIKSFQRVNKKRNNNEKTRFWEESFFSVPIIKNIVLKLMPKSNSPKGYKYKKLISESGEYTKIEYIYLRKIIFALVGFVFTICVCISLNNLNKSSILNNHSNKFEKTLVVTSEGQVDSTEIEKELIGDVNLKDIEESFDRIKDKLLEIGVSGNVDYLARKIILKEIEIDKLSIKIYHILIAILVMVLGYNIPEISLKLKTQLRKYEMQNEVIIFETVILTYMYHESATAELILENMSKFADIFKPQVDLVLKEVKKSDIDAVKLIVDEIKYKPFLNLIKNLIKAENIKTKDAFISLADNRRNFIANRKEDNKQLIYKSVGRSKLISLIPAVLLITCYIAAPLVFVSFKQLDNTQQQLLEIEAQQQQ